MVSGITAALALIAQASPPATGTAPQANLQYAMPIAGSWTYAVRPDGSEATFFDASQRPQLAFRCTHSRRRVALLENATAASPSMWIWTSSQTKNVPATYDAATARVSADLSAYDPLLDAIALSRGRVDFQHVGPSGTGSAALGRDRSCDRGLPSSHLLGRIGHDQRAVGRGGEGGLARIGHLDLALVERVEDVDADSFLVR